MLDLGCGHSVFPILCQNHLSEIVALDQNASALKWQNRKDTKGKRGLHTVLADMRQSPFKNRSINAVSSVSAIEHIPGDGDIKAASEIGRVLKTGGICLISFPLSKLGRSVVKEKWTVGVPRVIHRLFGFCFSSILSRLHVDRTTAYFERQYPEKDVGNRLIRRSACQSEDCFRLRSTSLVKVIHQKIVSTGVISVLEYALARSL